MKHESKIVIGAVLAALLCASPIAAQVNIDLATELPGGLPAGKTLTIRYRATIHNPLPAGMTQISNQGTLTGSNITDLLTNDPGTAAANDATVTLIDKAETVTAITSDLPDPSSTVAQVAVNYTVVPLAPYLGSPTGTVTVSDGVDSCMGSVAAGTCSLTLTTTGARTLTASYSGDVDFKPSQGTTGHVVITPTPTPTPSPTPSPSPTLTPVAATISILPDVGSVPIAGTVHVLVDVDTDGAPVTAGSVVIIFDPVVFEVEGGAAAITRAAGSPFVLSPLPVLLSGQIQIQFAEPTLNPTTYSGAVAEFRLVPLAINAGSAVTLNDITAFSPLVNITTLHHAAFAVVVDGRSVGDFDSSGCTDLADFLILLDNWFTVYPPLGAPSIQIIDFLNLLDNWYLGVGC